MRDFPEVRFVGNAKKEEKKQVKTDMKMNNPDLGFISEDWEYLLWHEYIKTDYEIKLTQQVIKTVHGFMEALNIEDNYNLSHFRFHLMPVKYYDRVQKGIRAKTTDAFALPEHQEVIMDAKVLRGSPVRLAYSELHELIHLKGHLAVNIQSEKRGYKAIPYRNGLSVYGEENEGYHHHFEGLEEAITAIIAKTLLEYMIENSKLLVKEKEILSSEGIQNLIETTASDNSIPTDEIYWLHRKSNNDPATYDMHPYWEQRLVVNYICDRVSKKFNDDYPTINDVLLEFVKAHFNGQILKIGRLVEDTFGSGSFRILGDMTVNEDSAIPVAKKFHERWERNKN